MPPRYGKAISAVEPERESELPESLELRLEECQRAIGYRFRDPRLLMTALSHASGVDRRQRSNERLEFLGDAVLGLVVCDLLYATYPDYLEGELTRLKSVAVSRQTCAAAARCLRLDDFLVLGKGMMTQTRLPQSVIGAALEAVIGAVYIDGGLAAAKTLVEPLMRPVIASLVCNAIEENYKSLLQQYAQKNLGTTPSYLLLEERGPDHGKTFLVAAELCGVRHRPAWGHSKKEAEQKAARNALADLNQLSLDDPDSPPIIGREPPGEGEPLGQADARQEDRP
ncbi:MAG: ribonuclease III [Thermogutta sp.]|nr:ribonuclease III [Thermogutta sp.]